MKRYDAVEFIERVEQDNLRPPLIITGMTKPGNDKASIAVDLHMDCKRWIEVPVSMIEKDGVVWLEEVACGDHTHPLVTIELKWPETQEALVFASAINAIQQRRGIASFHDAMAAPFASSQAIERLLKLSYVGSADQSAVTGEGIVAARQINTTCTNCINDRSSPFYGYVYCCEWRRNPDRPFGMELIKCWKVHTCIAHERPGAPPDLIAF